MTLFAKVLILLVIVCLPEIRTELGKPEVSRDNEKTVTNSSNASTICHFHILESSLKSVLKLMQNSKTNAIKLNVWIESINDTMTLMNRNRMPTDMLWVNELGRTLYSLELETEQYMRSLISYLPDVTLTAGFRDVNIVVSEDNKRCLLSKNNTMDHAIFDVLLSQLYSVSDVKTDYQFCHTYNLALNCCRIFPGDKSIRICSYYSSLVSHLYPIITVTIFALCLAFPVMVDYLSRFEENDYYTISISPMALSHIFYVTFFKERKQGQSRIKSFGRKLLIAIFVFVTWLPLRNIDLNSIMSLPISYVSQYIGFCFWAIIFLVSDMYNFRVFHAKPRPGDGLKSIANSPLKFITRPFHLKSFCRIVKYNWLIFYRFLSSNSTPSPECTAVSNLNEESPQIKEHGNGVDEEHSSQHCSTSECIAIPNLNEESPQITKHRNGVDEEHSSQQCSPKTVCQYFKKCTKSIFTSILILFYYGFAFPISCVLTLVYLFYCIWKFYKQSKKNPEVKLYKHTIYHSINLVFGIFVFGLLVYCSTHFFGSMVLFTIGVFLNGETYINYFLPLSTILFFSWTNWKSSVETKYLVLNTSIYEVCKNSTSVEPNALANCGEELSEYAAPVESEVEDNFDIKLNDNGEPIISAKLYHSVRKVILPYHRVLFYYFLGIFFVAVFAYFLYTMLSLSEDSGVTSTVQILGSMAATALPIIFNLVWKHSSDEQKEANAIALKSKLRRVLKIRSWNETNEEFKVEFIVKEEQRSNTQNVDCTRV